MIEIQPSVDPVNLGAKHPRDNLRAKGGLVPTHGRHQLQPAGFSSLYRSSAKRTRKHKMMISERYRRVVVKATQQEDHTWLARAGDLELPFRYPTAEDALREAKVHVDHGRAWPPRSSEYLTSPTGR